MLSLTKMIKVKVMPKQHTDYPYIQNCSDTGQGGKSYLALGIEQDALQFIIVDDIGKFCFVSMHNCIFDSIAEDKVANISQSEPADITLSNGVKAEITKQIAAKLKELSNAKSVK